MQDESKPKTDEQAAEAPAEAAGGIDEAGEIGEVVEETVEEAKLRLEGELADARDKFLRTMAEIENTRTRHTRDLEDARKYAATGFARDLLDVVDNLGRALKSVPEGAREESKVLDDLYVGVELTERSLLTAFEKHGIKKVVPSKGEKFDHKLHQAMFEVPTAELAPGHVADVLQPGYTIADRLLRAAMVGVTKAAPAPAPAAESAETPRGSTIDTEA